MNFGRFSYFIPALVFSLITAASFAQTSNAVGDAVEVSDECYTVTLAAEWQNGAVWFLDPINLNEPFIIDLQLNFGFNDAFGADGMVFVMQTSGTALIGEAGGGLGYGGIAPSLGIEFDTFENPGTGDLIQDHIALCRDGVVDHFSANNLFGPVTAAADGSNIEDGQFHVFRLDWNPDGDVLRVYFDCELRIEYDIDIVNEIFSGTNEVYWGFTGSTGGMINTQQVCLDTFTLGLPDDVEICEGQSIELGVNGPDDGTYEWTPVEGVSDPSISTPVFTPTETTTYTVVYTDLCGETQTDDVVIAVNQVELDLGPDVFGCPGEEVTIDAPQDPGATYTWNGEAGGSSYTTSESGTITLEYAIGECSTEDSVEYTQYDLLFPDGSPLEPETEICEGEEVIFSIPCDACTVNWTGNGSANAATGEYTVDASGTVTAEIVDGNGCAQSFDAEVEVIEFIQPGLPETVEACEGTSVTLTANVGGTYDWSTGDTSASISVTEAGTYSVTVSNGQCVTEGSTEVFLLDTPEWTLPTSYNLCDGDSLEFQGPYGNVIADFGDGEDSLVITQEGSYPVILELGETGCEAQLSLQVNGLDAPDVELPESFVLCEGTVATLYADVFPEGANIQWEDGSTSSLFTVTEAGSYLIEVSNTCGLDTARTDVTVEPCSCDLWVPNAFTPDGDGINEVFIPVLECVPDTYEFLVFNRWGEAIFRTSDLSEGWLGEVKGGEHFAINDIYAWMVTYSHSVTGEAIIVTVRGTVAIIR